jgi:hypothetical protein
MPRYIKALEVCLLPLLLTAAVAFLIHPPVPAQTGKRGLIAGGEPPDLVLAFTGDVIGYIDPCG